MKLLNLKFTKLNFVLVTTFILSSNCLFADGKARPDSHAPVSVIGDHSHPIGEFMFSYRYMNMAMEGNLNGEDLLGVSDILVGGDNKGSYLVAPLKMNMDMHMFGLMYAPSDTITLMIMLPYLQLNMDHVISPMHSMYPNQEFETQSNGLGDIKLTSIITLEKTQHSHLLLNAGLSIPSGSINKKDTLLSVPALGDTQLPFPMQLGSGTYDFLPGFTYTRFFEKRSWGSQVSAVIRLGRNDNAYTLGNRSQIQTWHAWLISDELSFSTRLNLEHWDNIDGDDKERRLPTSMDMGTMTVATVPSIEPLSQGGQRADIGLGFNAVYGQEQHRVGIELLIPVHQKLDGPQLERDLAFTFAYQKSFK